MIDDVAAGVNGRADWSSPAVATALGGLVAMAVVDGWGVLRSVSDRWCALMNLPREQVLGRGWAEVFTPVGAGSPAAPPPRFESQVPGSDGRDRTVRHDAVPLAGAHDAAGPGWLVVAVAGPDAAGPAVHAGAGEPGSAVHVPAGEEPGAARAGEPSAQVQRRLQVLFDNSADAVTVIGPDGSWRSATTPGSSPLGLPDGLSENGVPMSAVHAEDRAAVRAAIDEVTRVADRSFGKRFEFRVRAGDGRWLWLETRAVNLMEDPAVGGIVLHSRDVTESHEAAAELSSMASRLTSLVSHLFVGVMMADEDDELIFANRAASEMFALGSDPSRFVRMTGETRRAHLQRLHRDRGALDRIQEVVAARSPVMEERVELTTGRTLARSFVPILDDGAYRGHLWLYRDLTDEIAVAAEREYLLRMEKEQNARLTELDSLKSDLVASVSHELRTPLTSIVSFTHLLRDGLGSDGVADQAEFLDIITRNTDRLLRLVDDLLLLDRLESNSLQVSNEWVDFPSLVDIAVSSIRPAAREKGVTLVSESEPGPPLVGDVDRLGQLIDNLLANAVKFTPPKGQVRTEVARTEHGWRLVVTDTGIGIPMDEQHQLFERFYRASNARQASVSGSGLGLLIALRITELHRGTIDVKSVEGRGTTVTVELRGAARSGLPPSPFAETVP